MDDVRYLRGALACVLAASLVAVSGCARGAAMQEGEDRTSDRPPEVMFAGSLAYLEGRDARMVDGASGATADLFGVESELGWSGFAWLEEDGALIYEGIAEGDSSVRRVSPDGEESVLIDGRTFVLDSARGMLAVSAGADTFIIRPDAEGGDARPLAIGAALAAALSADSSEIAYSQEIDADGSSDGSGELEQRLSVRSLEPDGSEVEAARGWHAIEPILLDSDTLVYAAYPFGGIESADLILYDRRSSESTTLASGIRPLDRDRDTMLVAVAHDSREGDGGGVSLIDASDPDSIRVTAFEGGPAPSVTAARLLPAGDGLVAAFVHEDGASSLVRFDVAHGSQRTIAEFAGSTIRQILVHPVASVTALVLESGGPDPESIGRSIAVCDLDSGATSTHVTGSIGGLLHLIGFVTE